MFPRDIVPKLQNQNVEGPERTEVFFIFKCKLAQTERCNNASDEAVALRYFKSHWDILLEPKQLHAQKNYWRINFQNAHINYTKKNLRELVA